MAATTPSYPLNAEKITEVEAGNKPKIPLKPGMRVISGQSARITVEMHHSQLQKADVASTSSKHAKASLKEYVRDEVGNLILRTNCEPAELEGEHEIAGAGTVPVWWTAAEPVVLKPGTVMFMDIGPVVMPVENLLRAAEKAPQGIAKELIIGDTVWIVKEPYHVGGSVLPLDDVDKVAESDPKLKEGDKASESDAKKKKKFSWMRKAGRLVFIIALEAVVQLLTN
ncbi:hypothetical protein TorRG33x02_307920 [Trema orientale]|uniref:Uncharacterized protein n=1 Tax=Trema orientale TaxID=63057 RepID=A0A2P5BUZ7_TREOI|nr:hypothetical protein TorRG33x02_307920 [Trema orientale]